MFGLVELHNYKYYYLLYSKCEFINLHQQFLWQWDKPVFKLKYYY